MIEAEDAQEKGDEQIMTNDILASFGPYRAKVATELLLLIKDDFCELLMAYPYLRDMLMVEPEVDRNSLSAASKRRLSRENQLEDTSPIKLNEEVSSASYEPELSEIERGMPPTIVEGRRSEEDGGEASLLATANAPAPISLPGEECASCEQAPSSEAPAAYKRANSGQIAAKAQMRKSQQAAQSSSSLQRQGSSGGGLGARGGMKSPTNKSPGGTPQQPGPFSSPRGRANWQKLKSSGGQGRGRAVGVRTRTRCTRGVARQRRPVAEWLLKGLGGHAVARIGRLVEAAYSGRAVGRHAVRALGAGGGRPV